MLLSIHTNRKKTHLNILKEMTHEAKSKPSAYSSKLERPLKCNDRCKLIATSLLISWFSSAERESNGFGLEPSSSATHINTAGASWVMDK